MDRTKNALVTGANRGIGLEVARGLAREGYAVWLGSRELEAGRAAAADIDGARALALDVTDKSSIARAVRSLEGASIDLLVHNAGVAMDGFDEEVARGTLAVNFFGPLQLTDALLSQIPDGGAVVMVSSGMGSLDAASASLRARLLDPTITREALVELVSAFPGLVREDRHGDAGWPSSAYRVSKIALNTLTRILARDLAPRRIRVNAVCPGWVRTRMGGPGASRSVEEGAASVLATATMAGGTGGFYRDGRAIEW